MLTIPGVSLRGWSIMPLNQIHNMIIDIWKLRSITKKFLVPRFRNSGTGCTRIYYIGTWVPNEDSSAFRIWILDLDEENLLRLPWSIANIRVGSLSLWIFRSSLDERQMHTRLDVRLFRTESNCAVFFWSSCF